MCHKGGVFLALYVTATPIGNLDDITLRALQILREVDAIIAEDTRSYRTLAVRHQLPRKPIYSLYKGNEDSRVAQILPRLQSGLNAALVTESGTPAVSDPGALLVRRCHEAGVRVIPVPGPSALAAVLSVAGVFSDRVTFMGFLSKKDPAAEVLRTIEGGGAAVFYENPGRLLHTLEELGREAPDARVTIGRELTKRFEECWSGKSRDAAGLFAGRAVKGEVAVVVEPTPSAPSDAAREECSEEAMSLLASLRDERIPLSVAVRVVSKTLNAPRRILYAQALKLWEAA